MPTFTEHQSSEASVRRLLLLLRAGQPQRARSSSGFAVLERPLGPLVTTAWVLTEVADGLAKTRSRHLFEPILRNLHEDPNDVVVPATHELFEHGVALNNSRPDKDWSLTDCISFVVMRQRGITEALTGDRHFEQAGFVALLK